MPEQLFVFFILTNNLSIVLVRFLVETPESISPQFKGVFRFFERLEEGTKIVHLPEIVLFQTFFVLTSYYGVPSLAEKTEYILHCTSSGDL
jgi:hypothetical protein